MISRAWLSSLMLQMIESPIVCWEVKKVENKEKIGMMSNSKYIDIVEGFIID